MSHQRPRHADRIMSSKLPVVPTTFSVIKSPAVILLTIC
jgi:hypothetical protein